MLASGLRTADVMAPGCATVGTEVMGEAVLRELDKLAADRAGADAARACGDLAACIRLGYTARLGCARSSIG